MTIQSAKQNLKAKLEAIFESSAEDCCAKVSSYRERLTVVEGVSQHDGEPYIREAIRTWRDGSLLIIKSAFKELLDATRKSQPEGSNAPLVAERLTWEAVDETFGWTAESKINSRKFREWRDHTQVWYKGLFLDPLPLLCDECRNAKTSVADQLNCDFKRLFERELAILREEGVDPVLPVTTVPKTQEQAASTVPPAASADAIFVPGNDTYDSIRYRGKRYDLTLHQASIIRILHRELLAGFPVVKGERILEEAEMANTSHLRDSFKGSNKELWGKLIIVVGTPKGSYRLDPDITPSPEDL